MKSKNLPKDTKVAVYMRVGREEQLLDAVTEFIEKENETSDKITFKFTAEQVRVLRDALLTYNKPDKVCTDLFEHLGNRLRDYREKERENADRSTEKSQREVQQESNQNSH